MKAVLADTCLGAFVKCFSDDPDACGPEFLVFREEEAQSPIDMTARDRP
jgi:hypothetical protein